MKDNTTVGEITFLDILDKMTMEEVLKMVKAIKDGK